MMPSKLKPCSSGSLRNLSLLLRRSLRRSLFRRSLFRSLFRRSLLRSLRRSLFLSLRRSLLRSLRRSLSRSFRRELPLSSPVASLESPDLAASLDSSAALLRARRSRMASPGLRSFFSSFPSFEPSDLLSRGSSLASDSAFLERVFRVRLLASPSFLVFAGAFFVAAGWSACSSKML